MKAAVPVEARSKSHIAAFDGLRALAVIAVIVFHARTDLAHPTVIGRAYDQLADAGWVGVDLFFVLSGFLITGILLDSRGRPRFFRTFYARRTLRIFPLYYLVLAGALVIAPLFLPVGDPGVQRILHEQVWLWTYGANLAVWHHGGVLWHASWLQLTHLWSLAIEEQFYLVWPLVVRIASRRGVAVIAAAIVIGAPILRAWMLAHGTAPEVIYVFTPCRLDALAVGGLLAVIVRARPAWVRPLARAMMLAGGVALAAIAAASRGFDAEAYGVQTLGLSALAIFFGGVVIAAAQPGRLADALAQPPLMAIGRYSYGIYLFHALLMPLYAKVFDVGAIALDVHSRVIAALGFTALVLGATTVVAAISWRVIERPFLVLKGRFA